jgi:hypothetical protein
MAFGLVIPRGMTPLFANKLFYWSFLISAFFRSFSWRIDSLTGIEKAGRAEPRKASLDTTTACCVHSISWIEASRVFWEKASRVFWGKASRVFWGKASRVFWEKASRVFRRRRNVSRLALCFSRFTVSLDSARYSASESSGVEMHAFIKKTFSSIR